MKKIAYDIDGCVVDMNPALFHYFDKLHGIKFPGLWKSYNLEKELGVSRKIVDECIDAALADIDMLKPYPEAISFIEKYHKRTQDTVLFVTGRDMRHLRCTLDLLEKHITVPFDVIFTSQAEKGKSLLNNAVKIFIEDRLDFANEIASKGIQVYLIDKSYNQGSIHGNITRVYDWLEIDKIINYET
jgi:uncharacterized HAD superfamily protein